MRGLDFLLKLAAEAGRFDSQGTFTLALEEAACKMAAFQLPRRSAWILKTVQAAVDSGAERLVIKQSSRSTEITFSPRSELPIEELRQALVRTDGTDDAVITHLATGLRAVGFGDQRAFSFTYRTPRCTRVLLWSGTELGESTFSTEKLEDHLTVRIEVAFPPEDCGRRLAGLRRGAGRAMDEYLEVVTRAESCPIPLTFDGRRLDTLRAAGETVEHGRCFDLALGWPDPQEVPSLPHLGVPSGVFEQRGSHFLEELFKEEPRYFDESPQAFKTSPVFFRIRYYLKPMKASIRKKLIFMQDRRPSVCHWIRSGVICDTHPIEGLEPSGVSLEMYLSAEGASTDLSGLQLVASEELRQRIERALPSGGELLRSTIKLLREYEPGRSTSDVFTAGGTTLLTLFVFGSGLAAGSLIGALVIGGLNGLASLMFWTAPTDRSEDREHHKEMLQHLETFEQEFHKRHG